MAEDKKIGLGVDSSAMESGLSRLKKQAESVASEMIKNSRSFSTSSREVLKDIDEQIKALEKRNRLLKEQREFQYKSQFQSGAISEDQYKARMKGSGAAAESSSMTAKLLRELIDEIKSTSRDEIRSDRETVEKQIKASKTVDSLSPKGDARSLLKETVQRGIIGDVKEGETQERNRFSGAAGAISGGIQNVVGGAGQVAGASNASMALVGGLSFGGGVLGGLLGAKVGGIVNALTGLISSITQRALQEATGFQTARGQQYGITGSGSGYGFGLDAYGYTATEAQQERGSIARSLGYGSNRETTNALMLRRGFSLSSGEVGAGAMLTRSDVSGRGMTGIISGAAGSLQGLGMAGESGRDFSLMSEYLKILTELGSSQVSLLGETNSALNEDIVARVASLDESFKNPQVLGGVIRSLSGGLSQKGNPQVEALQYSVLSGLKPGASFFELQKMREDPFSKESKGYMSGFLGNLQNISGGGDMFYQSIKDVFGVSATVAEKIGKGFLEGRLEEVINTEFQGSISGRAYGATGELQRQTAGFSNEFIGSGDKVAGMLKGISDKLDIGKMLEYNEKILGGILDQVDKVADLVSVINDWREEQKQDAIERRERFDRFWNLPGPVDPLSRYRNDEGDIVL